jgi:hypothetical protein
MKKLIAGFAMMALLAPAVALAGTHYVKVSPGSQQSGGKIRLYGVVDGGCGTGAQVTIYSHAFAGATHHSFAGVPAVYAKVDSHHKFSTNLTLNGALDQGKYTIGARCGGGTLGHTTLTVTPGFY